MLWHIIQKHSFQLMTQLRKVNQKTNMNFQTLMDKARWKWKCLEMIVPVCSKINMKNNNSCFMKNLVLGKFAWGRSLRITLFVLYFNYFVQILDF